MSKLYQELVDHVRHNRALVVVGTGVSIAATGSRLASWRGLIEDGLRYCQEVASPGDDWADEKIRSLAKAFERSDVKEIVGIATSVEQHLGGDDRTAGDWRKWLSDTIGTLRVVDRTLVDLVRLLGRGRLFTCNYDDVLGAPGEETVPWTDIPRVLEIASGQRRGVVHLHGHWRHPTSIILGYTSYANIVNDEAISRLQQAVGALHSLVFVGFGAGLADPNLGALLKWMARVLPEKSGHHFQLLRKSEVKPTEQTRAARLIHLSYGEHQRDLPAFLHKLAVDAGIPIPQGLAHMATAVPNRPDEAAGGAGVTRSGAGPAAAPDKQTHDLPDRLIPTPDLRSAAEQYCSAHHKLTNDLAFCGAVPQGVADHSNLHYTFFNVPSWGFVECRSRIAELVARAVAAGDIVEARLWPLLGSMELLLSYREVTSDKAAAFAAEVKLAFGSNGMNRQVKIVPIDVFEEFARGPVATGAPHLVDSSMRNSWAFIYLQLDRVKAELRHLLDPMKSIAAKHRVVERIAFGGHKAAIDGQIVIELHIPCGMLPSLNQLSSDLEATLSNVASKSTYLAYDQYWPPARGPGASHPESPRVEQA